MKEKLVSKIKKRIQVEGRSSLYNPLLQKPIRLEPMGPGSYAGGLGGYAYIGPPPDFGGSYGAYHDDRGRVQYGVKSSKMKSVYDGSAVQLYAELSSDERDALMARLDQASEEHKCPHCRSELVICAEGAFESEALHCPYCGTELDGGVEKVNNCISKLKETEMKVKADVAKDAKNMDTVQELEAPTTDKPKAADKLENVQEQEAAATDKPKAADMQKPENEKASTMDNNAQKENDNAVKADASTSPAAPMSSAPASAPAPVAAEKSEDDKKAEAAKKEKEDKEKADKDAKEAEAAAAKKKETMQASIAKFKKERAVKVAAAKKETAVAKLDQKAMRKLHQELRVMATLNPAKFAEVKKNAQLSTVCAEVEKKLLSKEDRVQARKELMALAAEDMDQAKDAKKRLEYIAPEILMEEDVDLDKAKSSKTDAEKEKEEADKKAAAAAADASAKPAAAEAMKTEFLANLDDLKCESIDMTLGNTDLDPAWTLMVDQEPVAKIHLADQTDAEAIRAAFVSESYPDNLGKAINSVGLKKVLEAVNARVFAHKIDEKEIGTRIRAQVEAAVKAEYQEKVETIRQDFLRALTVASTGFEKNIFQGEEGHALKGELFNHIVQAGINEGAAQTIVEQSFEVAPVYFKALTDKAVELMDHSPEAFAAVEQNVMSSGRVEVAPTEEVKEESMHDRLVKASVNARALGGVLSGETKKEIRETVRFSANRR